LDNLRHEVLDVRSRLCQALCGHQLTALQSLRSAGISPFLVQLTRPIRKKWKLFTSWMVRTEVNMITSTCPARALDQVRRWQCIGKDMAVVRSWIQELGQDRKIRHCLTDDSAAEERAIQIAFLEDNSVYGRVEHLFSKWHSKQTLDRQLHGDILNAANEHLKAALFNRRSEAGRKFPPQLSFAQRCSSSIATSCSLSRKLSFWRTLVNDPASRFSPYTVILRLACFLFLAFPGTSSPKATSAQTQICV
jgi:hypothetical protein